MIDPSATVIKTALIFLPPRYHLLLQFKINPEETIVEIRTDYWKSLIHVDAFLDRLLA
jgi:AP-5 complex subunit beta-1